MPLADCVLVYDRWAYPIGKLDPHASFTVENKLDPQTVETYFKHVSILHEKDAGSTYDPASLDVPRIIEMMMFYEHLGGEDYTRLSNQYQHYLDASALAAPVARCSSAVDRSPGPNSIVAKTRLATFAVAPLAAKAASVGRFTAWFFPSA